MEAILLKVTSVGMLSMNTWVYHRLVCHWNFLDPRHHCVFWQRLTDLTKLWTGSQWVYKLQNTRTSRNLREHEGHYLNRDLPLSAEGLICFKTQKPRKTCEVQYLCSDPTGNAKGKCTCTPSTSCDLWSTSSFCGKCSVITLLWSYQTWNVQKKWAWQDGIFKNAISKVLYLHCVFSLRINFWL